MEAADNEVGEDQPTPDSREPLNPSLLEDALSALEMKKFSAIALVEALVPKLGGHMSEEDRQDLKAAMAKLDYQGVTALLEPVLAGLAEPQDA